MSGRDALPVRGTRSSCGRGQDLERGCTYTAASKHQPVIRAPCCWNSPPDLDIVNARPTEDGGTGMRDTDTD